MTRPAVSCTTLSACVLWWTRPAPSSTASLLLIQTRSARLPPVRRHHTFVRKPPRHPWRMMTFDEARLHPLRSDSEIEARVTELIGRANQRQLWLLFLDEQAVQLPVLMPVETMPLRPDDTIQGLAALVSESMSDLRASSVIVVFERYADAAITESDRLWARAICGAFSDRSIALRALLISHRSGVRWFAADDYLAGIPSPR